jgi:hypothetical protein
MNSCRPTHLLLISIFACVLSTSCGSSDSQSVLEKAGKRVLSRQEILDLASAEAREQGWDIEGWGLVPDEECPSPRQKWKTFTTRKFFPDNCDANGYVRSDVPDDQLQKAILTCWPMLNGHEYQAFWYRNRTRQADRGNDTARRILLDVNTGEVLVVLTQRGEVVPPKLASARPNYAFPTT